MVEKLLKVNTLFVFPCAGRQTQSCEKTAYSTVQIYNNKH